VTRLDNRQRSAVMRLDSPQRSSRPGGAVTRLDSRQRSAV